MNQKIVVPAVSVGLLVTAREAAAGIIDFGLIAESLQVSATITGNPAQNTIGGFTFSGLTFVGSHLNDVIGGNTVTNLLTQILGPEHGLTLTFGFSGNGGATGNFTILGAGLALKNNTVTVTENPLLGTITTCTPAIPGTVSGCAPGTQALLNPYDPLAIVQSLESANIITLTPPVGAGPLFERDNTVTVNLGTFDGNTYFAEEAVADVSAVPEPDSWSLAGLGAALLAWWRRRR
jgi:MYXO-CTERM domain-containing protein